MYSMTEAWKHDIWIVRVGGWWKHFIITRNGIIWLMVYMIVYSTMLPLNEISERLMLYDSEKRIENELKVSSRGSM